MSSNLPSGLPEHGYSMQAAAIVSALTQHEHAAIHRAKVREWLDRFDNPFRSQYNDFDSAQIFAEYLSDLARDPSNFEAQG